MAGMPLRVSARRRNDYEPARRWRDFALVGAVSAALLVRIPGIFWGYNFPTGWRSHHIDEYAHLQNAKLLIEPSWAQWTHPYPKGLAAHVAVPALVFRAIQGELNGEVPSEISVIVAGRVASVLYGSATVVLVFWLAKRLFRDERIALAFIYLVGSPVVVKSTTGGGPSRSSG